MAMMSEIEFLELIRKAQYLNSKNNLTTEERRQLSLALCAIEDHKNDFNLVTA